MHHLGKTRSLWSSIAFTLLVALPAAAADIARYILPPGNFGGLPFTANSTDQLPLYAGLTPLRDNITPADIDHFFLPEDFTPIGRRTRRSPAGPDCSSSTTRTASRTSTGRRATDVAFGAGWVDGARSRAADPARPRAGARRRRRRARTSTPSRSSPASSRSRRAPEAEALVTQQAQLLVDDVRRRRARRSSTTPRPTPTASTPTGRRTTSTSRPPP